MLTRTIKNTKVNFLNINIEKRTLEPTEITVDYGMTEKQIEKYLKEQGFTPADIKLENIPAARYAISDLDFFLLAEKIVKKSDIKGRSITKEITWSTAKAVFAVKENGTDWIIKERTVYAFNGNFDTTEYNSKYQKILEVGKFENESTALFGMTETDFIKFGTELK